MFNLCRIHEVIGNGTDVGLDADEIEETVKDAVEGAVDLNGNGHHRSIQ